MTADANIDPAATDIDGESAAAGAPGALDKAEAQEAEREEKISDLPVDATPDEIADKQSKDSFPASDPPAW
ncbi:MAG TPA: hypothetical protein VNC78_11400 [Actinomycetota bacterium]|nr:hypothetical protein [Actinomycetota bacterium]